MWKTRPVVGSTVGGIVDQIIPGETGYLLADPNDLASFADLVSTLLADRADADRIGRTHASEHFLSDRHLEQWAQVITHLH
jgi:trehalose synthase